jgi:hypothetical protein
MLQAARTGVGPEHARALLTGIWLTTNNGKEFQAALGEKGWVLARGDRRDFVAIDPTGGIHSIARRIEGAKAADVRARFADIDPRGLQGVAEAKQAQRERHAAHKREGGLGKEGVAPRAAKQQAPQKADAPRERRGKPLGGAGSFLGKLVDAAFLALMGEKPTPNPDASRLPNTDAMLATRREQLMRQLAREIPTETEQTRNERDQGRERTRG